MSEGNKKENKSQRDYFRQWLSKKHTLGLWIDLQGKRILSLADKSPTHARAFQMILSTRVGLDSILRHTITDRKCIVDCGSACCYFPGKNGVGVYVNEGEVEEITRNLKKQGLDPREYVRSNSRKGKKASFMMLSKKRVIPKKTLTESPILLSGEGLWNDKKSRACSCLRSDNTCRIYGNRPASCRVFACRTCSMINLLFSIGVITPHHLDGRSIKSLNSLAERTHNMFSDDALRDLDQKITVSFIELVKAYLKSERDLSPRMQELIKLGGEYDKRRMQLLRLNTLQR